MKRLMMAVVAALASACAFGDIADYIEGTVLTVPAGETVTAGADDAATVGTLTQVVFADAKGAFEMKDGTFAFAAAVSGAGTVKATDAAGLTVSGDSRGFTGGWLFSNSTVLVTSRYGLGDSETGEVVSYKGSAANPLSFSGAGCICDVPLHLYDRHALRPLDNGTDPLVFNSYVKANVTSGTYAPLDLGYVRFDGGLRSGKWPQNYIDKGVEVYINGMTGLNGTSAGGRLLLQAGSSGTGRILAHLTGQIYSSYLWIYASVDAVCEGTDVLNYQKDVAFVNNAQSYIDLNGCDQEVASVHWSGYTPTEAARPTSPCYITSESPATITFDSLSTDAKKVKVNAIKFTRATSLHYKAPDTYTLGNVVSDTTGNLHISDGTLVLQWGAGWRGANAIVDGGILQLDSTESFKDDSTELTVTSPGKVVIGSDVLACFSAATIGGASIAKGTYTVAELVTAYPATEGLVEGEGSISIDEHTPEIPPYEGDLEIEGTVATVPRSCIVTLTDADAARLAPLTEIVFKNAVGKIICANTSVPFTISAAISGPGQFTADGSAGVTLNGDNSGFTGEFSFDNSIVEVTNAKSLGNAASLTSKAGSKTNPLRLPTTGIVLDMPVTLKDIHSFATTDEGEIVFNGLVTLLQPSSGSYGYVDLGNVTFNGGFSGTTTWPAFRLSEDRTAKIKDISAAGKWCIFANDQGAKSQGRVYRLSGSNSWGDGRIQYVKIICDSDSCLGTAAGQKLYFVDNSGADVIDLNGHDQNAALFYGATAPTESGSAFIGGTVENSSPDAATFTINGSPTEDKIHNPILFSGNLSLVYDSAATWKLAKIVATATGSLTVKQGTFVIEWGAGWRGSDVIVDGGTLSLTSAAALADDTTALEVKSGTLDIAAGVTAFVKSATIGGATLAKGVYPASQLATAYPGLVSGSGTLAVDQNGGGEIVIEDKSWTGNAGNGKLTDAGNWEGGAPDFTTGGANLHFPDGAAQATVDAADLSVYGIEMVSSANFTLNGTYPLTVGAGGIRSANVDPAAETETTNSVLAPLAFPLTSVGDWSIGAQSVLAVGGGLAGGSTAMTIGVGGGKLLLDGDNAQLLNALALTNSETRVYSPTALGSPLRRVEIRGSTFRAACDEIDTPVAIKCYGVQPVDPYADYNKYHTMRVVADPGQKVVFRQKVETLDAIAGTLLMNDITLAGGFVVSGGGMEFFVEPGFVGAVTNGPIDHTKAVGQYALVVNGGGTFELGAANNIWYRLRLMDGTTVRCVSANTLVADRPVCFGKTIDASGALDLNGFDQSCSFLSHQRYDEVGSGSDYGPIAYNAEEFGAVTSAEPATLTLGGATYEQRYDRCEPTNAAVKVRGKVNLRLAMPKTVEQRFLWFRSDTTGTIAVDSGILALAEGASFREASALTIGAEGRVRIDAASAAAKTFRKADVSVAAGGVLELADDAVIRVKSLTAPGAAKPLANETYGGPAAYAAGKVDAAHTLDFIEGAGLVSCGETGLMIFVK